MKAITWRHALHVSAHCGTISGDCFRGSPWHKKSVSRTPAQVSRGAITSARFGEAHLSTDDDPKDRAAIYGMHIGEALARQHTQDAQNILPVYAENSTLTLETREAMITGMWSAYIAHLIGHISVVIGEEATAELLQEITAMHHGAYHAHH